jgi:hypothetical protein
MRTRGKWGLMALAAFGLAAVGYRAVVSQQPAGPASYAAPVNPLVELFAQALPDVEAVLGEKLNPCPTFRTVTFSQLVQTPDFNLDAYIRLHFPQLQGETLARARQVARVVAARASLAHYVEGDGAIVLAPENAAKIAAWSEEVKDAQSQAFLQLAMVYQAVRMHFDRKYAIARLRGDCRDADELDALEAVVAGRAQAVTAKVAQRLGSGAHAPLLPTVLLHVPDDAPDPLLKTVSQTALRRNHRCCMAGWNFFNAIEEKGVHDCEAAVMGRLPRQMATVMQPGIWVRCLQAHQLDLAEVLRSLENSLPVNEWAATQQSWAPTMLEQAAAMLGAPRERAERIGETWFEGRTLVWADRSSPDRQIALTAVRHINTAGALAHFGFILDFERKQDAAAASCGLAIHVTDSKTTPLQLVGFDEAIRCDKHVAFGDAQARPMSSILARSGDLVLELTVNGQTADAALVEKLLASARVGAR